MGKIVGLVEKEKPIVKEKKADKEVSKKEEK